MNPEALAWIEKQKPDLVGWAETFVNETKLFESTKDKKGKPTGKPEVQTSQLRNLLNAAQSGSPLAVLKNFLRYQIGRDKQAWRHRPSGDALLNLLEKDVKELCQKGVDHLAKAPKGSQPYAPNDRYELEAHLAAQLLGFIVREYTYRCRLAGTKS